MKEVTSYGFTDAQAKRLDNVFTYHAPHGTQAERYAELRSKARALAEAIIQLTPESREQSLALTKAEEASMWANAAIARGEA